MSKGNRLLYVAFGGWLLAILGAGLLFLEWSGVKHDYRQSGPTSYKGPADWDAALHYDKPDTEAYLAICQEPQNKEYADLCQQWRMAQSANQQATFTAYQFVATIAEIIALAVAIGVSGWAAREAGRAATAADAVVKVTQDTAQSQLRAYVTLSGTEILRQSGRVMKVIIMVKNTGQTPALGLHNATTHHVGKDAEFDLPGYGDAPSTTDIGAGIEFEYPYSATLKEEDWEGARLRNVPLYVWGEVRYWDFFKKELRHTSYRLTLSRDSIDKLSPTAGGNRCT